MSRPLSSEPSPYRNVAEFYDAEHAGSEADIAFFDRHATGGPVLVGGCGTGRVSRALSTNHPVTGLDSSSDMLVVARRLDPKGTYVWADLRTFDLGARFQEVILPNGAFNFLGTRADQAACLERCRAALRPGGVLTLDMPMPLFSLWGSPHEAAREAWSGRVDGERVVRTRETRRTVASQRLDLTDRYYVGGGMIATSVLDLRIVLPCEAEWMLEGAGFWVDSVEGDYGGQPLGASSPRVLVRAVLN